MAKHKRGGARPGSGPAVRRLNVGGAAAQELKIITLHRRAVTGNQELQPVDVVVNLIHAAWIEYDAMIQEAID